MQKPCRRRTGIATSRSTTMPRAPARCWRSAAGDGVAALCRCAGRAGARRRSARLRARADPVRPRHHCCAAIARRRSSRCAFMRSSRPGRLPARWPITAWRCGRNLVRNVALEIAAHSGRHAARRRLAGRREQFVKVAAADLIAQRGRAMVLAGPRQPRRSARALSLDQRRSSMRRSISSNRSIRSPPGTRNRCASLPATFTPAASKR